MSKTVTISFSTLDGIIYDNFEAGELREAKERIRSKMSNIVRANGRKLVESKTHTAKVVLNR